MSDANNIDLNEIVRSAEQLSALTESTVELPQVQRSLQQILDASNELWCRITQTGSQENKIQAHLLLGSKGVDLPQITNKLHALSTRKTFESLDPIADTDIGSYLKNEEENAILSIIEKINKDTFQLNRVYQTEQSLGEWKQWRSDIMNSMTAPSGELIDLRGMPSRTKLAGSMITGLSTVEVAYSKELKNYNTFVLNGTKRLNLFTLFTNLSRTFNDKQVEDMWSMVSYIVEALPVAIEETCQPRSSDIVEQAIVDKARKYLENRYKEYMTSVVNENLVQAQRGGVPGTFPLVKSFVGIQKHILHGLDDICIEDRPLWPLVYHCIRAGDLNAALFCLNKFEGMFQEFKDVLEEAIQDPRRRAGTQAETMLKLHYRRHMVAAHNDPYKLAAYCALVPCEPDNPHSEVIPTVDDWLWLKLCQIREEDENNKLTLEYLQKTVVESYGEKHYKAHENPFLYFSLLFLTNQFESAVEFLARGAGARHLTHAVHLAAALHEHSLLATSSSVLAPLISADPVDEEPEKRLNFARLVLLYVKRFETSEPRESLNYLFLLRSMKDPYERNMFAASTAELIVDASPKNRKLLLQNSESQSAGSHSSFGILDEFHINAKDVINISAEMLYKKGILEDAVILYDLVGNHEKVLTIMCTLLAQVVSQKHSTGSLRSRLQNLAVDFSVRYQGTAIQASAELVATFFTLRDLMSFFDEYHDGHHQSAFKMIWDSKLVPLNLSEVEDRVNALRRVAPEITGCLADILLATMTILYRQFQKIRSTETKDVIAREQQLKNLRENARSLTSFAGSIPYRLPNETNAKLVQMEIYMT